jgi:hypothetical protein
MTKFMDKRMTVNVKLAQRFVRSLARKAGRRRGFGKHASRRRSRMGMQPHPWGAERGWGEGNGHGEFHYQGWQLAMTVRVNYGC